METSPGPGDEGRGRRALVLVLLVIVVLAAVAAVWLLSRRPPTGPKGPPVAPRAGTSPVPRATPAPTAAPEAGAASRPRVEPRSATTLRVDSDVPGANVFLDRKFLGATPVQAGDVAPGPHRLNVSAEGYEMYGETVELVAGPNELTVKFKEVKLDESIDVAHKHGVGSCKGRLVATPAGLRYESAKAGDSFDLPLAQIEPLEVDYLKRNLKVKQRGGRTWNFTAGNADALLVFQKKVEKARTLSSETAAPEERGATWAAMPGLRSGEGPMRSGTACATAS